MLLHGRRQRGSCNSERSFCVLSSPFLSCFHFNWKILELIELIFFHPDVRRLFNAVYRLLCKDCLSKSIYASAGFAQWNVLKLILDNALTCRRNKRAMYSALQPVASNNVTNVLSFWHEYLYRGKLFLQYFFKRVCLFHALKFIEGHVFSTSHVTVLQNLKNDKVLLNLIVQWFIVFHPPIRLAADGGLPRYIGFLRQQDGRLVV